jgi:hypothetical protein
MKPGKRKALDKANVIDAMVDQVDKIKASIRAKAEHPFRVIKRQFCYVKVRYRGFNRLLKYSLRQRAPVAPRRYLPDFLFVF